MRGLWSGVLVSRGPRLSETEARAARVGRMLAVLDQAWWALHPGQDVYRFAGLTIARLEQFTDDDWHDLARQADPAKEVVKPPSDKTRGDLLAALRARAATWEARSRPREPAPPIWVCSVCGGRNCRREACGEEAGIRGLPREVAA